MSGSRNPRSRRVSIPPLNAPTPGKTTARIPSRKSRGSSAILAENPMLSNPFWTDRTLAMPELTMAIMRIRKPFFPF
jgi:hypothetical protein